MKLTTKIFALAVAMAMFAVPALAQTKECNDENKGAWYKTFYDNFKGSAEQQKVAYDAAKTYLTSCPSDPNDKQAPYMDKWVKKYDEVMGKADAAKKFEEAVKSKNYADQIKFGKEILASDADNAPVNIVMGLAGLENEAVRQDSAQAALKAISLIEAGKPFAPVASKEQALAFLNWVVAKSKMKSDPNAAIPYFLKAAKIEADPKKSALLYNELAAAYGDGPVAKLTAEYKSKVAPDNTETPESKLVLENLNQNIDRQIDALARATALAAAADKANLMGDLTTLYKYRNKSDAGLNEMVAGILSKPIPDIPTPITTLSTTATTPAQPVGATNAPGTNAAGTNGTAPAKPTPSPTPTKKPR